MRRSIAVSTLLAAALALGACTPGPSEADADAVATAVGAHDDVVTLRYVDTASSTTSQLSLSLTVGVAFAASPVDGDALATVLCAIAAALPSDYRHGIIVSATQGDGLADLTDAAAALGLPASGGLASGELHTTVREIDDLAGSA